MSTFTRACLNTSIVVAITLLSARPTFADKGTGPFRVSQTMAVGGDESWDYVAVDADRKLLYLPRSSHTMVIDATNGKIVSDIPGQKHNHGVALVPSAGRGFISDGSDAAVVVFDLKTSVVLGKIKAEEDADGIIYDPASRKVFVVCGDASVAIPIPADVDPASGKADAPIQLGGKPEYLASDGQGKLYIDLVDKDQVAVVDTKTMQVVDKWSTRPGGKPVGLSIDPKQRRLFVGCRNPQKLIVMSADDGKVIGDLPIGAGCDGTQFDNGYAFASCRDASLTVAHENSSGKFEVVQTLKTRDGAKTLCVDPTTHSVFLPAPSPKPNPFVVLVVTPSSGR